MNTLWIDLGEGGRLQQELAFESRFIAVGCEVHRISLSPENLIETMELIASRRVALKLSDPFAEDRDLLAVSYGHSDLSISRAEKQMRYFVLRYARYCYQACHMLGLPLKNFLNLSLAVILPRDVPDEFLRRWGATNEW